MLNPAIQYCRTHWQGKQSLLRSFWINLVALRLLLLAGQHFAMPALEAKWETHWWLFILWVLFAHVLVLVWQIVGTFRAAERDIRNIGIVAITLSAQLALIPIAAHSAVYIVQMWSQMQPVPPENNISIIHQEWAKKYTLEKIPDTNHISFSGTIEFGLIDRLAAILKANPQAKILSLDSTGGNIYVARGLARLIGKHGLNTHVSGQCLSACTTVFIGGTKRSLSRNARLGFHQYRFDTIFKITNIDPRKEQARDLALFKAQGVTEEFRNRLFEQPSNAMWYPDHQELLQANVVHVIKDQ